MKKWRMTMSKMDFYSEYIAKSRYSRFLEEENRREHWDETVDRYMTFMEHHLADKHGYSIPAELRAELREAIVNREVMPSMRSVMTAGPALERDNTAGYNCSYLPVDDVKSFDEAMYILLCGTGVGFSVETKYINKLPEVPEKLFNSSTTIVVKDSKEGWAKSLRQVIALLYAGEIPKWDVSAVRPAGARLKTFGGRASGPGPLEELFKFVINKFKGAAGRKLNTLECHDIMCKIGEVVVVGGVRRSAMISLSDLTDDRMRHAKSGNWWEREGQRALANNSATYTERPSVGEYMAEWLSVYQSFSGERGIFSAGKLLRSEWKQTDDETLLLTLVLTRVLKSSCGHINSVTLRKLSQGRMTLQILLHENVDWQLSSELSNLL
jgi:ribonucleoside-triphosphate reductase (thioredoxin)